MQKHSVLVFFSLLNQLRLILAQNDIEYVSNGGDIYLGGLFPVHANPGSAARCGRILDLGVQRLEAMVHAVQLVNNDSELLPGMELGFSIKDTCINSNYALEQSLSYVTSNVQIRTGTSTNDTLSGVSGVIGAASSSVSIAVASLFRLFNLPQISYASTARFLSDKTRFDYFLRTIPPDLFQAQVMVDIVVNYNWTYVITICSEDTYGEEGIKAFTEELVATVSRSNNSFSVAITIKLPVTATKEDYDKAVIQMNSDWVRNSSVVVLFGQLATAEGVLSAVSRYKKHRLLTFIVSDAVGDQLPSSYHSLGHGMISVLPTYYESKSFNEYFTSLRPSTNPNPWFKEYWGMLFNCSFGTGDNMEKCHPETEESMFISQYKQNSKVPFVIDAVYAFAHALQNLMINVCGEIKLCDRIVGHRDRGVIVNGELLLQYIKNVSFVGVSSDIKINFDSSGDVHGWYWIKNLQRKPNSSNAFQFLTVGNWNGATLNLTSDIEWATDSVPVSICSADCMSGQFPLRVEGQASACWICEACPRENEVSTGKKCTVCPLGLSPNEDKNNCDVNPLVFLRWVHPFSILILLLTLVGLIATSVTVTVFIINYSHSTVKASSRELSTILLIGIFLCYLLPFFSIGEPIAVTCAIRRFGFGFSFSLCYAALLVKVNRIHRIFNRKRSSGQRPPLISPHSQLLFTGLLVLIQVILSASWLVVQVPGRKLVYYQYTTEVTCKATAYFGFVVSLGYNFLLLLVSTYYAFRTRKIPQNFNEARFINLTLYSVIIIWLAFIPATVGVSQLGTVYETGAQIFAIVLSATATLCCLFFSKLYFMFSSKRKEGNFCCLL